MRRRCGRGALGALALTEAGRDHHRGAAAALAKLGDQPRDGRRRGGHHRHVGRYRKLGDGVVAQRRADRQFVWIDGEDRPGKAGVEEIASKDCAHRSGLIAGADKGNGLRLKEGIEIAGGHCGSRLVWPMGAE